MRPLLHGVLVVIVMLCSHVTIADPVVLDGAFSERALGRDWQVFEDQGRRLQREDLPPEFAWQPSYEYVPNYGFSDSAYWFRLRLESQRHRDELLYLEIGYPLLSEIDVYWQQDAATLEHFRTGYSFPYASRPVANRHFVFPLALAARSGGTLWVRVHSLASVQFPATLWTTQAFRAHEEESLALLGVSLGIPAVMLFYNLFLFFSVRDRRHAYFAMHAFSLLCFVLMWQGALIKYLLPEFPEARNRLVAIAALVATYFCNLFAADFLELQGRHPTLARLNFSMRVICLALMGLSVLIPLMVANVMAVLLAMIAAMTITLAVAIRYRDGDRTIKLFSLAWLSLIIGVGGVFLNHFGLAQMWLFTERGLFVSLSLEVLFISCALADRLNAERALKRQAQELVILTADRERAARNRAIQEARDAQQALSEAVDTQANRYRDLEHQVQERTLALEQANRRLLALYDEDPLTGLKNRRFFMERLEEECSRAHQRAVVVTVMLVDIDHFKRINDEYGHLRGDQAIRHVAQQLASAFARASDCVARFGGEEFAVILADMSPEEAVDVAERTRERIATTPVTAGDTSLTMTVSIGVVSGMPQPGMSPDLLLENADRALYRAKGEGRNRVCLASD